jgi:hypothetical protein
MVVARVAVVLASPSTFKRFMLKSMTPTPPSWAIALLASPSWISSRNPQNPPEIYSGGFLFNAATSSI